MINFDWNSWLLPPPPQKKRKDDFLGAPHPLNLLCYVILYFQSSDASYHIIQITQSEQLSWCSFGDGYFRFPFSDSNAILDYTHRAGWPEEPMFWIANAGFLFVNCQILSPRIKKSKKHYFFGTFFDHQIQVFYSWSGQILDPKLVPGPCTKITFAKLFEQKQVKCPFTLSSCGIHVQRTTSYEHKKIEASTQ